MPDDAPPKIAVRVDDETYEVDFKDCTALDASQCRQATGLSLAGLLQAASEDPDLDIVAAVIWLAKRQNGQPDASYHQVASELSYDVDWGGVEDTDLLCPCGFEAKSEGGLKTHQRSCAESDASGEI